MFRVPARVPPPFWPSPSTEDASEDDVDEHGVERGGGVEGGREGEEELVGPAWMALDEVQVDKRGEEKRGEEDVGWRLGDERCTGADDGEVDLSKPSREMKDRLRSNLVIQMGE